MDAIGIDLGTTNCCVAVVKNGRPEVIVNEAGDRTTPSYITFWKDEILFGSVSKKRSGIAPRNTIHDVKRFIGMEVASAVEEALARKWRFDLVSKGGNLMVHVNAESESKFYRPEELSGMLLKQLKRDAERYLGHEVTKAVITVPTYFHDSQRQATIDAGSIAGFEEVHLLNESTAAAIAYAADNEIDEKNVLIFDCGGGTFDISIVKLNKKQVTVLGIDGDLNLGGNNVDSCLLDYSISHIEQTYNYDARNDDRLMFRLRSKCESIKVEFASSEEAILHLENFMPDDCEDLVLSLSRADFDSVCANTYDKAISIVERCISKTSLRKEDIDDVVLVGGSTKIRGLVSKLEKYFNFTPKRTINPDEAVAVGAAIQASFFFDADDFYDEKVLNNLLPYDLGVETDGGEMNVIVARNSLLPTSNSKIFCTTKDNQEFIIVKIFSGDSHLTEDNNLLGSLKVSGFPVGPKHSVKLKETFEIDENGILVVSVVDLSSGDSYGLEISLDKGRMTEEEISDGRELVAQEFGNLDKTRRIKQMKTDALKMYNENGREAVHDWLMTLSHEDLDEMLAALEKLNISI
ncbi:PREDICTED: heat shock 70 kDa protein 1A-like [Nicrophorus vespilloides]|uniref:Heat shock 70 kDa protein 1A-like n=1 Tax=Nicrophorus vespilloides TaxID=110193 RepID=A0ABM1MX18_NICVS|nr:PREDICTED: heat shock 70 kDa protein 1A-like [Nicrophorus vespilloides]